MKRRVMNLREKLTKYFKIKYKYIDVPILIVGGLLLVVGALSLIYSFIGLPNALIQSAVFPILSIFANLIILKMIQITMSIEDIKFNKINKISIVAIFLFFIIYYGITLYRREFIYYWDYSNYIAKQYTLEEAFGIGTKNGIITLLYSFLGDYTGFINIFTEFPFCLTSKTGDCYVMVQLVNVFLPILLSLSILIKKIGNIFKIKNKNLYFSITLLITITFPLLHKAALKGQPDWFGIIFCMIIICLTIDYKFEENNILRYLTIFISTASLVITRRWYLYFIVAYYFAYTVFVLIDILKNYASNKKLAITQLQNLLKFGIVSMIVMGTVFFKIIHNILSYDYGKRYASYLSGGVYSEIIHQIKLVGLIYVVLMLIGVFYSIIRKKYYIVFIAVIGVPVSLVMFTRIQNMGDHQSLLLLPFYLLSVIMGIVALLDMKRNKYKVSLVVILIVGILNCFVNYFKIDFKMYALADCNLIVESREDIEQVRNLAKWIDYNCGENDSAYVIPHDTKYNPDIIKNSMLPNTGLFQKVSYGSAVLGTHAFPIELFDAKYVITCEPFPNSSEVTSLAKKYNELFKKIAIEKFKEIKKFDMENGTIFYVYSRIVPVDVREIDYYFDAMKEEDKKFPDLFSEVKTEYIKEHQELLK